MAIYLGLAGIVSLPEMNTKIYNKLLEHLGAEGMLMQFERMLDEDMLNDLIAQIQDNLYENNISNQ